VGLSNPDFTVGGTVTGLPGAGLVLQLNGGAGLSIVADGTFTFPTPVTAGSVYGVTILAQPATGSCAVLKGAGPMPPADVTNVAVDCSTLTGFSIAGLADPLAPQQWHLKNTGQTAFADTPGIPGFDLHVDPAFGLGYTGSGVTVAVVDTGLEIAHEDLAANVITNSSWNFNSSSTDPTNTVDTAGDHGTSVAGLIAMARNSVGGIGVAPRAGLKGFNLLSVAMPLEQQFLDSIGASVSSPNSVDVAVFNQSFGVETDTPMLVNPTDEAQYLSGVTSLRGGRGALYVKAAGNGFRQVAAVVCPNTGLTCENANFDPDNTLPFQVVVGAVNASGVKASYSTAGSAIWVSAPGGEFGQNTLVSGNTGVAVQPAMVTTDQSGCAKGLARTGANTSAFNNGAAPNTSCNYTNDMNGTSSATPVTVGAIALMLEANPALTWRDVKHILASTSRKIDAAGGVVTVPLTGGTYVAEPGWTANHASPTPFNYHNWYGFGLVDAAAAVVMAKAYTAGQLGTLVNTGFIPSAVLNLPIPDQSAVGASSALPVPANPVQVVEAVQIRVNITHPVVGELGIELVSPTGTRSVLKNIVDGYSDSVNLSNQVFLSNAFYGENPAGAWTIKVVDGFGADTSTGTLVNWAIRVYGH
jgi:subtilisin-like proprotein convertase family protein